MDIKVWRRNKLQGIITHKFNGNKTEFCRAYGISSLQSVINYLSPARNEFGDKAAMNLAVQMGLDKYYFSEGCPGWTRPDEGDWVDDVRVPEPKPKAKQAEINPTKPKIPSGPTRVSLVYLTDKEMDIITAYREADGNGQVLVESAAGAVRKSPK